MFATGPGSIPWFLVSELFNQSARPAATSLAVAINWTANFLVGLGFLPLQVCKSLAQFIYKILNLLQRAFLNFNTDIPTLSLNFELWNSEIPFYLKLSCITLHVPNLYKQFPLRLVT